MNCTRFLRQVFDNYAAASIDKLYRKAHEILDNVETKTDVINFETLQPDDSFNFLNHGTTVQDLRMAITRTEVARFLKAQEEYAVHSQALSQKPITYWSVKNRLIKFQMDIIDIGFLNRSFRYILSILDMFSKYAFLVPLTNKSGESVAMALDKLFGFPPLHLDVPETVPKLLLSDSGLEFKNSMVREVCVSRGIGQIFSKPYHPLGMIERFNQTIKRPIRKIHQEQAFPRKKAAFVAKIQVILTQYNTSIHSSTKFPPIVVHFTKDEKILRKVYENLEAVTRKTAERQRIRETEPLHVGDVVRVQTLCDPSKTPQELKKLKDRQTFKRFVVGVWTRTHFTISTISKVSGTQLFTLRGYEHETFKRHQLLKVMRR